MNTLQDILDALTKDDLTDEQIGDMYAAARDMFTAAKAGEVDGIDKHDISTLRTIAEAATSFAALAHARFEAAAAVEAELAELEAQLEPEAEVEDEVEDTAEAEVEDEVEDKVAEPVAAAARPPLSALAAKVPAKSAPRPAEPETSGVSIIVNGKRGDRSEAIQALSAAIDSARSAKAPYPVKPVKFVANYPAERRLNGVNDMAKIEAVIAAGLTQPKALTAASWCAVATPVYDVVTVGTEARPVRDSLPGFSAHAVSVAPGISVGSMSSGTDTWPHTPDTGSKACITLDCGNYTTYEVDANTACLNVDNLTLRAHPELVEAALRALGAASARRGETALLDAMIGLADNTATVSGYFGTFRELGFLAGEKVAAYRSAHRAYDQLLRLYFPAWVRDAAIGDLLRGPTVRSRAEAASIVDSYFAFDGVGVTWYLDTPTGQGQQMSSTGVYPATARWGLGDEGHFIFIDGGELDLGVSRSPESTATNSAQIFSETFEGVAKRGVEFNWYATQICATGEYADADTEAVVCAS